MDNNAYQYSANPNLNKLKRLAIILVCLGAFLLVLFYVYRFVFEGRMTILTNNKSSSIVAVQIMTDEDSGKSATKQMTSGKSAFFTPGSYEVTVSNSDGSTSETVTVKPRHSQTFTINTSSAAAAEPVADVNAPSFVVGTNNLEYFDQSTDSLNNLDGHDNLSKLSSVVGLSSVEWADPNFGAAKDQSGDLFAVIDNQFQPIAAGLTINQYTVAPDHTIYIASGNTIYKSDQDLNFHKLFTVSVQHFNMAASDNYVAISTISNSPGNATQFVEIWNGGQKIVQKEIGTYSTVWSADGKYLATTDDGNTQIFDKSLNLVDEVPSRNVNNLRWLNGTTLIYTINNQLWQYSLSSHQSRILARTRSGQAITFLTTDPSQTYVYMSAEASSGTSNNLTIRRVGLNNQPVPGFIDNLQAGLPWLDGTCLLSLTNFASPTVQSFGGLPQDNCQQVAKNYVGQLGIDASKLQYKLTSVPPDEAIQ